MKLLAIIFLLPSLSLAQAPIAGTPNIQVSTGNCSFNVVNSGSGSVSVQYHGSCGNVDPKFLSALQKLVEQTPQTIENLNAYLKEKTVDLEHTESLLKELQVEAERDRKIAQARELAAQADSLMMDQPDLGALLLIESMHRAHFVENDHSLRRVMPFLHGGNSLVLVSSNNYVSVFKANISIGGGIEFSSGGGPRVILLDEEHRKRFLQFSQKVDDMRPPDSCWVGGNNTKACLDSMNAFSTVQNNFQHQLASVVAFSADGKYAAIGRGDGTTHVFESDSGKEVKSLANPTPVPTTQFSVPDSGKEVMSFPEPTPVVTVALSSRGQYVVAGYADKTVQLFELPSGTLRWELKPDRDLLGVAAFSPDDLHVSIAPFRGREVDVLSTVSGIVAQHLTFKEEVSAAALMPGGRELAVLVGTTLKVVSIPTMTEEWHLTSLKVRCCILQLYLSLDGRYLAAVGFNGRVQVFQFESGKEVYEFSRFSQIRAFGLQRPLAAFSSDGQYLAVANLDNSISVFDLNAGKEVANLLEEDIYHIELPTYPAMPYTIMPDQSRPLRKGLGEVAAVTFSSDGKYLEVAYSFWEDDTKRKSRTFLRDNEMLFTRYTVHSEDLVSEACSRISRNLTQTEWKQYIDDEPYQKTCPNIP